MRTEQEIRDRMAALEAPLKEEEAHRTELFRRHCLKQLSLGEYSDMQTLAEQIIVRRRAIRELKWVLGEGE